MGWDGVSDDGRLLGGRLGGLRGVDAWVPVLDIVMDETE